MSDLIERKSIRNLYSCLDPEDKVRVAQVLIDIDAIPTIDAVEVVRGEWIDKPTKGVRYICSRCTGRFDYQWKYCPNCGAKMKGADDE